MSPPPQTKIELIDPSQIYRPEEAFEEYNREKDKLHRTEKNESDFRNFDENLQTDAVKKTYTLMHSYQTMDFVKAKIEQWGSQTKTKMAVMDAVFMLDALIDESDPDTDLPNSIHAFQTAERIRAAHPDKDWFHLVGLLHDLGKVLALWGEPQWAVVGDTFPLGCKFSRKIVFPDTFINNSDIFHPIYSSKYGIYGANCGLDNVTMSWGHDGLCCNSLFITMHMDSEYMYRVLTGNKCTIPEEGLYMVRYHSFYPWHACGEYDHLCSDRDREMLPWVMEFNKFDLYSKADKLPDIDAIRPYYEDLITKYCPVELQW